MIKTQSGADLEVSKAQFDRFYKAALSQAQQKPIAQLTALTPPDFKACVAEKQKALPADSQRKTSTKASKAACEKQYTEVRNTAMQQVINLNWIKGEAARRGITFRKSELTRELNTVIKTSFKNQAGYQEFLKTSGLNDEDVRLNIVSQLGQTKIVAQLQKEVKTPTDAELRAYFNQKQADYVTPETRDLRVIKAKDEADAKAAKAAIEGGKSWTETAKQYSTDELTKSTGGKIVGTTAAQQPVEFGSTVFKAKANTLLGPIKASTGWYVVYVGTITPEKTPEFATLKDQLSQQLLQEKQQASIDSFRTLFLERWAARTSCAGDFDDLVACGGVEGSTTTTPTSAAQTPPPGAGVPQYPVPTVDPSAQQLDSTQAQTTTG